MELWDYWERVQRVEFSAIFIHRIQMLILEHDYECCEEKPASGEQAVRFSTHMWNHSDMNCWFVEALHHQQHEEISL